MTERRKVRDRPRGGRLGRPTNAAEKRGTK